MIDLNQLLPIGTTHNHTISPEATYCDWFEQLRPQEEFLLERCVFNRKPGAVGYSGSVYRNIDGEYHVFMVIALPDDTVQDWGGPVTFQITNVGAQKTLAGALELMANKMITTPGVVV